MDSSENKTGGQVLVDCLLTHGVDRVFCVPGESYLAVLDALRDVQEQIEVIVCRHEGAAAHMAEAYGKLTGRPGICFVTRGPGATHASVGVHTARQDSTPMILFVGQVERDVFDREGFQEVDYRAMFGPLAKLALQIENPDRIPEYLSRAFHTAVNGRPGPVVLALPENTLSDPCQTRAGAPYQLALGGPAASDFATMQQLLAEAKKPMLVLGGSGWSPKACEDIRMFAEHYQLPTAVTFRRQDLFDNEHPLYAGVLGLGTAPTLTERVKNSDLLLVVGDRLSEAVSGTYSLIDPQTPSCRIVHVHPDPNELGRIYQAEMLINASVSAFADAAAQLQGSVDRDQDWVSGARADYEALLQLKSHDTNLNLGAMVSSLNTFLPDNAIITNGAGSYAAFVHRYYQYRSYPSQLAPASGTMGYGVPAAITAKLVHPERPVVCFAGDGCFLMTSQELSTAVRYKLPIIFVVIDNESYGSIRMHQDKRYPSRDFATELQNPDFVAYARSFGANGEQITTTEDFGPAIERALAADAPTVLLIQVDVQTMLSQSPRRQ